MNKKKLFFEIPLNHPVKIIIGFAALTLLSIFLIFNYLKIQTSRRDLVSDDVPFSRRFTEYTKEFGSLDTLILIVEGEDEKTRECFMEKLYKRLGAEKEIIDDIYYRTPLDFFHKHAFLYLDKQKLNELVETLEREMPSIVRLQSAWGYNRLFETFRKKMEFLMSPEHPEEEKRKHLSSGESADILNQLLSGMKLALNDAVPDTYVSPLDKEKSMELPQEIKKKYQYVTSVNNDMHFMFIYPKDSSTEIKRVGEFIGAVRDAVESCKKGYDGIKVGMTGAPALSYEETLMYKKDTKVTSIAALIAVLLLFVIGFRSFLRPIYTVMLLTFAITLTYGATTVLVGHLNLLSMSCSLILIGLGIDFGIHIISRYEEEWVAGKPVREALSIALHSTGPGIIVGAGTTAVAFFTLKLTGFKGYEELGTIAGVGVLICLLVMLWMLPAVLMLLERDCKKKQKENKHTLLPLAFGLAVKKPRTVIILSIIFSCICLYLSRKLYFDYSLMNLQAEGTPSVENEYKMIENSRRAPRFAVIVTDNLKTLKEETEKLKKLDSVEIVESVISSLPENQEENFKVLTPFRKQFKDIRIDNSELDRIDVKKLFDDLWASAGYIDQIIAHYAFSELPPEAKPLVKMRKTIGEVLTIIHKMKKEKSREKLIGIQKKDFLNTGENVMFLKENILADKVNLSDIPHVLKKRFIGKTGKFQAYIFPEGDIWNREFFYKFVGDIKNISKEATGLPVFLHDATELMKNGTINAGIFAAFAILLLLFKDFKDIQITLFAMTPLAIGLIWMTGLMRIFNLNFNPANIISLPLILGIGVDNGVHILHRYIQDKNADLFSALLSTGKAIFLCSMTTILSFAGMSLAHHRGLASLGKVLVIGVSTCMIAAIFVLPSMLILRSKKEKHTKNV